MTDIGTSSAAATLADTVRESDGVPAAVGATGRTAAVDTRPAAEEAPTPLVDLHTLWAVVRVGGALRSC
ncbi:hypothetical protein ABT354_02000 [Streptomyces sp. NPDC000594]|uniref:hypothetical protein n=1 Tax=Streptomyces sp. NPDC000594 TaxID=3154261 RepID=UPI0033225B9E